ncbi:overlapping protein/movement protein [Physalis mottle virus]|uniref:Overlapping protein n=1 Tax=Physalis mottle virus TaxID=72539 RepID=O91259_PHMV|nr:overlapping protein/movement protein [Physalis mottle virus]CAA76070.1 overlapping protein [Physalis mottle virus]
MSHVLPGCSRCPQLNISSRCFYQPHTQFSRRASSRLSFLLSLPHTKGGHSSHLILRHSSFRTGYRPSPSPHPQNHRNPSSFHSLAPPCSSPIHCDVHETFQIPEASGHQSQLLSSPQLPSNLGRHLPIPRDVNALANHDKLLHARRSHVLPPLSNSRPLHELRTTANPLLQPHCSPRIPFHQPFSLSLRLYLSNSRPHPALHPRISPCRQLRPASRCPLMAQDSLHPPPISHPIRNSPGILGPMPLPTHTTRPPSKTIPLDSPATPPQQSNPTLDPITPQPGQCQACMPAGHSKVPTTLVSILHDTRLPGTSTGHLPPPTPQTPPHPALSVQLPLHLHPSRPYTSDLRPRRLCKNPIQQTRAQMGHSKSLGQSPDFCPSQRSNTTSGRLRVSPKPSPTSSPPSSTTLAAIPPLLFPPPINTNHSPHSGSPTPNPFSHSPRQRPILPSVYRGPVSLNHPSISPIQQTPPNHPPLPETTPPTPQQYQTSPPRPFQKKSPPLLIGSLPVFTEETTVHHPPRSHFKSPRPIPPPLHFFLSQLLGSAQPNSSRIRASARLSQLLQNFPYHHPTSPPSSPSQDPPHPNPPTPLPLLSRNLSSSPSTTPRQLSQFSPPRPIPPPLDPHHHLRFIPNPLPPLRPPSPTSPFSINSTPPHSPFSIASSNSYHSFC